MRMMKFGALAMAAALGGCALFPSNINSPNSVFSDRDLGERRKVSASTAAVREAEEADIRAKEAEDLVASGRQDQAEAQRLRKEAKILGEYAVLKTQKGEVTSASASTDDPGFLAGGFERDVVNSWNRMNSAGQKPEDAQAFLYAGMALVNHRCGVYFRNLGLAAQKSAFASKELSLTTGVVAALQGLTGVASRDIAIVASSLGFLGASSQAYTDSFVFSPDVGSVEILVLNSQQAIKAKLKDIPVSDFNKTVAINSLQDYEKTCEVKTIRRLINESLSSAHPIAGFQDDTEATLDRLTRATLAARMQVDAVTDEQLTALYWIAYKTSPQDLQSTDKATVLALLKDFPKLVASGAFVAAIDPVLKEIRTALAPFVSRGTAALDAKVLALQAAKPPGAVAAAAPPKRIYFSPSLTVTVAPSAIR